MEIKADELKNASWDARIELTELEEKELKQQLIQFFAEAESMKNAELDKVKASFYGLDQQNKMRKDKREPSLPLEVSLANAPDADESCFHVPKIIEE